MPDSVHSCPMCGHSLGDDATCCAACGETFAAKSKSDPAEGTGVRGLIGVQLAIPVYFLAFFYGNLGRIPWGPVGDAFANLFWPLYPVISLMSLICILKSDLKPERKISAAIASVSIIVASGLVIVAAHTCY